MRTLFLLAILVLLGGSWIGGRILQDAGYVLLAYDQWSIETSLWVGVTFVLLGFVAFYFAMNLILGISRSPQAVRQWLRDSRLRRSNRHIAQGLQQFSEGYWKNARKLLVRSAADSEMPTVNYLVAAWAADREGDDKTRMQLLQQAQESAGSTLATGITEVHILIERQEWQAAEERLHSLRGEYPDHLWLLRLSQRVFEASQNWQALAGLLPELKKKRVCNGKEIDHLQQRVYLSLLEPPEVAPDTPNEERIRELMDLWNRLPASLHHNFEMVSAYCRHLMLLNSPARCEMIIRDTLKKRWNNELVRLYGLVEGGDVGKQLQMAEGWLRAHPNNAFLLLALGRISLRNGLWGKARNYLEASIRLIRSPEAFFELGRLLEYLGEDQEAEQCFRNGLERRAGHLVDLEFPPRPTGVTN